MRRATVLSIVVLALVLAGCSGASSSSTTVAPLQGNLSRLGPLISRLASDVNKHKFSALAGGCGELQALTNAISQDPTWSPLPGSAQDDLAQVTSAARQFVGDCGDTAGGAGFRPSVVNLPALVADGQDLTSNWALFEQARSGHAPQGNS
jgi:hypothetical protein